MDSYEKFLQEQIDEATVELGLKNNKKVRDEDKPIINFVKARLQSEINAYKKALKEYRRMKNV